MVEPEDIRELEDLHRRQREKDHPLGTWKPNMLVKSYKVAYLIVSKGIAHDLSEKALYGEELVHIMQFRALDAISNIGRESLIQLVEARVRYLSSL